MTETKFKIRIGLFSLATLFFLTNCQNNNTNNDIYKSIESLHFQNVDRTELFSITNDQLMPITGSENIHISTMTSDQNDQIYLFEWYSGKILKFDSEGKLLASAGGRGIGPDEFDLEESGVGLIKCNNSVIAHDMNRPNFKVYDHQLIFRQNISVSEPIWNISCADDGDLLIVYISKNSIDKINLKGEIVKSFKFDEITSVEHNNLRLIKYTEGRIYNIFAAENLLQIFDLNASLLKEIRFPSIENDLSKRITAKALKIYAHNNQIHIVAKLKFGLVIHRFTLTGDYINTLVLGNDYINIHHNRDDRMQAIRTGNHQLTNYRLD